MTMCINWFCVKLIFVAFVRAGAAFEDDSCEVDGTCGDAELIEHNEACIDKNINCPRWEYKGECKENPDFMSKNCPMSCGICGIDESIAQRKDCKDMHEKCAFWAEKSECTNNPSYMMSHCMMSCGSCSPPNREEANEINLRECEDFNEECKLWSDHGECLLNSKYMSMACRRSCGFCVNTMKEANLGASDEEIERKKTYSTMNIGVLPLIEQDDSKGRAVVVAMEKYAKDNVTNKGFANIRELCINNDERCAFWVSEEECEKNPTFMLGNCPLACKYCDMLDKFSRCAIERHDGILIPGYVKKKFEKMGELNEIMDMEFILSPTSSNPQTPWFARFNHFLSLSESQALIELGNKAGWDLREDPRSNIPRHRSHIAICDEDCDEEIKEIMDKLAHIIDMPLSNFEFALFEKYEFSESTNISHDFDTHDVWKPAGPCVFTIYICLSDVDEGGSVGFPDLNWLIIEPQVGQALWWANVMDNDPFLKNENMGYEALPVVGKDVKYTVLFRVHLNNWRDPYNHMCT
mmetsp:Transcript_20733/g.23816  ORF Transcript_20733/g.23816 Transcript_20733/m.23816 type:complete len:522 (-) Transcript_20733:45-1610(-)